MTTGNSQSVPGSVNKGLIIGFNISTTDATSTPVITAAQITSAGASRIRDIHLKCTSADGWLGLGEAAVKITSGITDTDIVPIFKDGYFNKSNVKYSLLNVIRDASTNVTVKGYVVVS